MGSNVETSDTAFAFTTGTHGGRPTYLLTPNAEAESLVLYELMPEDVAAGRQTRFERSEKTVSVTDIAVSEAIVGGDTPSDVSVDESLGYQWGEWCAVKVSELSGTRLDIVGGLVEDVLADVGVNASELLIASGETVCVPEAAGVRLTIAFTGMKHIRRNDKLRCIRRGVEQMSLGECYYWHSKIKSPNEPNGATALRELLAGHIN